MSKQLFLLDKVLIFCVLALASAQRANNVKATYQSYNPQKIKWNLNTSGVFCAAQDGNKSLSWRSEFGWTAFCGPVGKGVCGKCLNVTNKENGIIVSKIVRFVDTCTNGGLELDIDVFQKLDSSGTGNAQSYLMVDYEFVDCDCNTKGGNCGYISTETRRQAIDVSSKSKRSFNISTQKPRAIVCKGKSIQYGSSSCLASSQLRHPPPPPPTEPPPTPLMLTPPRTLKPPTPLMLTPPPTSPAAPPPRTPPPPLTPSPLMPPTPLMSTPSLPRTPSPLTPPTPPPLTRSKVGRDSYWKRAVVIDFGLAKLCLKKDSIVSMSDQRGTMGYVAPEVWNRHFGGVSHKSDVYSYGMMLLEMVGGRKNINADASHTSEIYFPHWVYSRLEHGGDLRSEGIMDAEEDEIARRMTIVGLWCIQTFPRDRPTMSKVIEMLEVNMNSLEIPPKPLHSSPTRSISESSTS